jgi:hypothetical protein
MLRGRIHSIGALAVSRSSFLNNSGGQTGGGICQVGGQSTIENCIFTRNIANNGGGLSSLSSAMNVCSPRIPLWNKAGRR